MNAALHSAGLWE